MIRAIIVLLLLLLLPACSALPHGCIAPAQTMVTAELIFGRKIGNRVGVSDADFAAFTAAEITPRFPDGLTVIDAQGQWRDGERNAVIREPSKLVRIIFPDDSQRRTDLSTISDAYKKRFRQESVLMSLQTSCVTF